MGMSKSDSVRPDRVVGDGDGVASAAAPPGASDVCGERIPIDRLDERLGSLRLSRPNLCRAMTDSLARYGQLSAVLAADIGDALCVVDGFKRLVAARKLGWPTLRVQTRHLSEQASVAALFSLNQVSCGLTDLEQARIVWHLHRQLGMTQVEVGQLLGRGKAWVCRRLSLIERLDEDVQRDIQVGLLSVTTGRELARLPRGNQAEVAATICRDGLTTREASALVTQFAETGDRAGQRYLLDQPREALEASSASSPASTAPDPRMGTVANRLRRRLLRVQHEAAWLNRQLSTYRPTTWTDTERSLLAPILRQTEGAVSVLLTALAPICLAMETANADDS